MDRHWQDMGVKSFVENLNRVQTWKHFYPLNSAKIKRIFLIVYFNCGNMFYFPLSSSEHYQPCIHVLSMKLEPEGY